MLTSITRFIKAFVSGAYTDWGRPRRAVLRLLDDRPFWLLLIGMTAVAAVTQITTDQIVFRLNSGALRPLGGKVGETVSVTDFPIGGVAPGWGGSGIDSSPAFALAMASSNKTIRVPAQTSCYNLGTTGVVFTSYHWLRGEGRGNPSQGPTCFTYTGTGCGVTFDSVTNSGMSDIDVQVNSTSATARGVCFKSTTGVSEFNTLENVSIQMVNATPRTAGQVGLDLLDNNNGIYWNVYRGLRFRCWDLSLRMTATGTTQGVNSNQFYDLMSFAHNTAYQLRAGSKQVTDNRFYGMTCSRSDGTLSTATACLMMGDDNVANVFGNSVYGLNDDSGAPDTCGVLGTNAGANYVDAVCESGGGFADNNTTGTFPNAVFNHLGLGSLTQLLSLGNLNVTKGATIIGTTWNGIPGGGSGGAGGAVTMAGGLGNANQPGGDIQFLSGGGGTGTAAPGNVLVSPGPRQGAAPGGSVIVGPASGLGLGSGTRIRSSRVTIASKPFAAVDCAGLNPAPTVSQTLDASIFTCATAQTITLPTAQGASGLVQGLPGNGVTFFNGATAVGDEWEFLIVSTAAANFTLAGGTGTTIVGNPVVNNSSKRVICRVTNVGSGTETQTCYL